MKGDLTGSVTRCAKPALKMAAVGMVGLLGLSAEPVAAQGNGAASLDVRTISTRAEAVSGGEVLVQIAVPRGVASDRLTVSLNGRDVRAAFR